jgi:hypothetical protein
MTETLRNRELEFLTYLRNYMTDPNVRGLQDDDTFSASGTQTRFVLSKLHVRNILSVTVGGTVVYPGHDYTVVYGEGDNTSIVTFRTAPSPGTNNIIIIYKYGPSMINEGFQREDSELPRISMIPIGIIPEFVSIGEENDGTGNSQIYETGQYVCEIRSRFAGQLKSMVHEFLALVNGYRQIRPNPYRTLIAQVTFIQPEDFDNELRIYRTKVMVSIKWLVDFGTPY